MYFQSALPSIHRTVNTAYIWSHRGHASEILGKNAQSCSIEPLLQATWHRDLHGRLSHNRPVWLGVQDQAGRNDCTRRQWRPQSHDLQSDHGGRSNRTCNAVANLQTGPSDYTCNHSHRLIEPAAKGESGMGCPDLQTATHSLCVSTVPGTPVSVGMKWQIDGKHSRYHIWSAAWQGRGAQSLRKFLIKDGQRSGERKRLTFHPLRPGTISVQPDKHWRCLKGNLWETA